MASARAVIAPTSELLLRLNGRHCRATCLLPSRRAPKLSLQRCRALQLAADSNLLSPAMRESLLARRVIETKDAKTIADGLAVRVPIAEALEYLAPVVDDVVLVEEASLRQAMSMVMETTGLIGEPAGVAGIAALIEHEHLRAGGLVATPLCGSNQ